MQKDTFETAPEIPAVALPVTAKQLSYARTLAMRNGAVLPWEAQQDRRSLSALIEAQARQAPLPSDRPSSKQVAFAERIARAKRRDVPEECFQSRDLMSRWITANKH